MSPISKDWLLQLDAALEPGPGARIVEPMQLTDEQIESFAIRVALGNNGGTWADHYHEEHRNHWRQFVRDLAQDVSQTIQQHGRD